MIQKIFQIALVVKDYDEAIEFYTRKMDFELIEDTAMSSTKRWVVVAPKGSSGIKLLLAKAANEDQASRIGNQTGGRVFLFMHTDDLMRDYEMMKTKGVVFIRNPIQEEWGLVAVFEDLYGNLWDLIQLSK